MECDDCRCTRVAASSRRSSLRADESMSRLSRIQLKIGGTKMRPARCPGRRIAWLFVVDGSKALRKAIDEIYGAFTIKRLGLPPGSRSASGARWLLRRAGVDPHPCGETRSSRRMRSLGWTDCTNGVAGGCECRRK